MTGDSPYSTKAERAILYEVVVKKAPPPRPDSFPPTQEKGLSDELWLLLTRCWNHDARERPTAAQVRTHVSIQSSGLKVLPLKTFYKLNDIGIRAKRNL
jgi:hypothetical protein